MLDTKKTIIDARTIILLLVLSNIITFTQNNYYIEIILWIFLFTLLSLCGCIKQATKWIGILLATVFIQTYLLPLATFNFASGFFIMFSFARKIIPCIMIGSLIINKIPSQYLILALRKFKLPNFILIPLSVTIRYIPSLKQEYSCVKDSIKLRNIPKSKQIESIMVSLIINATRTADELSAAAVTRGIENPCKKTSVFDMNMQISDTIIISIALTLVLLSILSRGTIL